MANQMDPENKTKIGRKSMEVQLLIGITTNFRSKKNK